MFEFSVPRGGGRLPVIDELKGLAILGIVLYHAGGALVWRNLLHGDIGVDIFLLLSGLTLAMSSREEGAVPFLRRRLLRVFPAYWIALAFFLILHIWVLRLPYSWGEVVAHVFGVHAFFGDAWAFSINPSFWFITPLFVYYLAFPWLRHLLARPDRFVAVAGASAALVALGCFFLNQGSLMGHWGFRGLAFFLGALLGRALRDGRIQIPVTPWLGVGLLLAFYVPYMWGIAFHTTVAALGVMLAYVALRPLWIEREAGARVGTVLAWCGAHSLEIFLLHQPLMRDYVYWVLGRQFGPGPYADVLVISVMTLALGVTLILAIELRRWTTRLSETQPQGALSNA